MSKASKASKTSQRKPLEALEPLDVSLSRHLNSLRNKGQIAPLQLAGANADGEDHHRVSSELQTVLNRERGLVVQEAVEPTLLLEDQ